VSARAEALSYWPWNYFRRIPTYVVTVPERYRQTDRRTTYCRITALCASIAR